MGAGHGSSDRVGRALRRSPTFWLSLVGAAVLFAVAALAPLLANSAPLLYDDGEELRSPAVEYLDRADWRWLAALVLGAATAWRLRRALRLAGEARRRRLRSLAWTTAAALLALSWAIGTVEERVLSTESFLFDSLRIDGPRDGEWVLWAPVRWSPEALDLEELDAAPPSREHPFGKDRSGGDLFARVVHGSRVSLSIGVASAALALAIGVLLGGLAGFFGGGWDLLVSRVLEVFQCFPDLFLILVVLAYLPAEPWVVILLLGLLGWPAIARLTRAEFLRARNLGFVDAARSLGCSRRRIAFGHVLPHASGPALVAASFGAAGAMLTEAGLSYLGLGGQDMSWGRLLQASRSDLEIAPQVLFFPGLMMVSAIACFHFLGEAVRDALDPHSSRPRGSAGLRDRAREPGVEGSRALLDVRGLCVDFPGSDGPQRVLDGVDLQVAAGERVGLVGASGSGKSLSVLALLRLLDATPARVEGEWSFDGVDLRRASARTLRRLRGARIGVVFQDPASSLDPVRRVGRQLVEAMLAGGRAAADCDEAELHRRLAEAGLQDPARVASSFPHELSGGMQQRVGLALALAADPELLIADEPTTGLDVVVQAEVLRAIGEWSRRTGAAVLWISHDLSVVAALCQRVVVAEAGRIVDAASVEALRAGGGAPTTRRLIEALPENRPPRPASPARPAGGEEGLRVQGLGVEYRLRRRFPWSRATRVVAAQDVALRVHPGEVLALVGESGCGKSSVLRALAGLLEPTAGSIELDGRGLPIRSRRALRAWRREVQLLFQDTQATLDPRRTVFDVVAEGPRVHRLGTRAEIEARVRTGLTEVGLDAEVCLARLPHEFSGGQRARIALARALAVEPRYLLLDEPVASLDVVLQAELLELLHRRCRDQRCGILLVSHDLAAVRRFSDRLLVMQDGRIVESGPTAEVLERPAHELTRRLLDATPSWARPQARRDDGGDPSD